MRFSSPFLLVVFILMPLAASPSFGAVTLLGQDQWKLEAYGFAELDAIGDSTRSLSEVPGSTPIGRSGTPAGENGRLQISDRNSRLGFNLLPPLESDWHTRATVEFDLLGIANNASDASFYSSPSLRMRHAYFLAQNGNFKLIVGQYWTLFGWNTAYLPLTASVPPITGTTYERTPQLRAMETWGDLEAGLSLLRPPQSDAELPAIEGGLRYQFKDRQAPYVSSPSGDEAPAPMGIAVTGTLRDFVVPQKNSVSAKDHYEGYAVAVDGMIPIFGTGQGKPFGHSLTLSGEYTTGRGYGDYFASWTGDLTREQMANIAPYQALDLDPGLGGYDSAGAFQLVKLQTFNLELQYHLPSEWHTFFTVGYAQLYSSNASGLGPITANTVAYDQSEAYFANLFHDFTSHIRMAAEYAHFKTKYADGVAPVDDRYQISGWFRF